MSFSCLKGLGWPPDPRKALEPEEYWPQRQMAGCEPRLHSLIKRSQPLNLWLSYAKAQDNQGNCVAGVGGLWRQRV